MNQRELSRNILTQVIKEGGYANLLMRNRLNELPVSQRAFCTEIINGVLRNYYLLRYQYQDFIEKKLSTDNEILLNMAMYERFFLKEKDYAVNNEYVSLCKEGSQKSFINAILRKTADFRIPDADDKNYLSIIHSMPDWIISLLSKQYSKEDLLKILDSYKHRSEISYRLNIKACKKEYLKLKNLEWINDKCFRSKDNLLNTREFKYGYFYVQDANSSYLTDQLELKEDSIFLDMCSAPGSKLFNALDIVDPKNSYCNDLYSQRVELIRKKAQILRFKGINYLTGDAREIGKKTDVHFTHILLDAPCSGLGVIGRRPDLKFHITPSSLDELETLQREMLDSAYELLLPDGVLLYSTCTLNTKENARQVRSFLKKHEDIVLDREETIIDNAGDCFYYARMILKK